MNKLGTGPHLDDVPVCDAVLRWASEAEADGLLSRHVFDGRLRLPDTMAGCADVAAAASRALRVLGAPSSGTPQQQAAHDGLSGVYASVMRRVLAATGNGSDVPVRRLRSPVHGLTFRAGYPDSVFAVDDGDIAELVPEPDNPHDPLAVRVDVWTVGGAVDLGYLPGRRDDVRREIHALAADRDVLGEMKVRVSSVNPGRPGADVTFDLPYDMDLFLRLLAESEASLLAPSASMSDAAVVARSEAVGSLDAAA